MTAIVLALAAAGSWLNARLLKLPVAVGLLVLGLALALAESAALRFAPELGFGRLFAGIIGQVDYPRLVLQFMLAYLLFAGALNVDVAALGRRSLAVGVLATLGVIISAAVVAAGFWAVAAFAGRPISPAWALVFGVLISPTDPVAVLGLTKRTTLDVDLKAQIEGEALFNDGVAVVLFGAALAFALGHDGGGADLPGIGLQVLVEAGGGALLGLAAGLLSILVLRAVDDWAAETLATVALATGVYTLALHLDVSAPIAAVAAGLVAGSPPAERAMSESTRRYVHGFWRLIDENMNAVLFLLLGLELFTVSLDIPVVLTALAAVPIALAGRWVSVAAPAQAVRLRGRRVRFTLINLLTWAGVRGGLSVAMALSLPDRPEKPLIVAAAFAVVIVSMLLQSMTTEALAVRTGYGQPRGEPEPVS